MHKVHPSGQPATNGPCMFPTHHVITQELAQRKKVPCFGFLHSKLLYAQNRWGEEMIINLIEDGWENTAKKYIYIAHHRHVYFFFFQIYIIQHLAGAGLPHLLFTFLPPRQYARRQLHHRLMSQLLEVVQLFHLLHLHRVPPHELLLGFEAASLWCVWCYRGDGSNPCGQR